MSGGASGAVRGCRGSEGQQGVRECQGPAGV